MISGGVLKVYVGGGWMDGQKDGWMVESQGPSLRLESD